MKNLQRFIVMVLLVSIPSLSSAALVLSINSYESDRVTLSIAGVLDADTEGTSPGYLAIKNDWSNNFMVETQWFFPGHAVSVLSNTVTIGGVVAAVVVQNGGATSRDNVYWTNPAGASFAIAAGTAVTGSLTLIGNPLGSTPFDLSAEPTLELLSGFQTINGEADWFRLESRNITASQVPEINGSQLGVGIALLLGLVMLYREREGFQA